MWSNAYLSFSSSWVYGRLKVTTDDRRKLLPAQGWDLTRQLAHQVRLSALDPFWCPGPYQPGAPALWHGDPPE